MSIADDPAAWQKLRSRSRSRALRTTYENRVKLVKKHGWGNRGDWDNWFHPETGWNHSLLSAVAQIKLEEELARRKPCKEYDADCGDMTVEQIQKCHAKPGPEDDHCGFCVMKQRCN